MVNEGDHVPGGRGRLNSIGEVVGPLYVCGVQLSNQFLLRVAAVSFLIFVLAEIVGALASNSLSLLGDAAAMSVDVFTYFCNMYSEHVKAKYGTVDLNTRMILEVGIPLFSVTALLAVSAWITYEAISIIIDPSGSDDVNVYFLYGFAAANFLVDVICAVLFYLRRGDVLKTTIECDVSHSLMENQHTKDDGAGNGFEENPIPTTKTNLNMASALTHIGGDTLRTAAVFIAALISSLSDRNSTLCDAWAAVVVTITIIFFVGPLLKEIGIAHSKLMREKVKQKAANANNDTLRRSEV